MRFFVVPLVIVVVAMAGCQAPSGNSCPPAARSYAHAGPGVDGPGPGVIPAQYYAAYGQNGGPAPQQSTQIAFMGPEGATISWDVSAPGAFDSAPLTCPGRYNFPQSEIYRLKLANLPGRPGVELYPTIEVATAVPRTEAFLAHAPVPVEFTQEDLDQVLSGNFVTKVVYLPDPEFQELAVAGVGTLVSTRLDPGVDPINEASHRGAILAVVRIGNKDLQLPGAQQEGAIAPASYQTSPGANHAASTSAPLPMGVPANATAGVPTSHVAGMTTPQYGYASVPTPLGLPGPPYIPQGNQAGLQKIVYRNHACEQGAPKPVKKLVVDVHNGSGAPCIGGKCKKNGDCPDNGNCPNNGNVVASADGSTPSIAPSTTAPSTTALPSTAPTAAGQNCVK
jgi:hypothetical protein